MVLRRRATRAADATAEAPAPAPRQNVVETTPVVSDKDIAAQIKALTRNKPRLLTATNPSQQYDWQSISPASEKRVSKYPAKGRYNLTNHEVINACFCKICSTDARV